MKYNGSCHCGAVAFEAEGEIGEVMSCNCSICRRKGFLLWPLPREKLRLVTKPEAMATYTFNKHVIQHRFCATCGIHPFAEATAPSGQPMAAVNARCLEGIDISALQVQHFDGRSR